MGCAQAGLDLIIVRRCSAFNRAGVLPGAARFTRLGEAGGGKEDRSNFLLRSWGKGLRVRIEPECAFSLFPHTSSPRSSSSDTTVSSPWKSTDTRKTHQRVTCNNIRTCATRTRVTTRVPHTSSAASSSVFFAFFSRLGGLLEGAGVEEEEAVGSSTLRLLPGMVWVTAGKGVQV